MLCSLFFRMFCCFSTIKSLWRQNYTTWCRGIKNAKARRVKFVRERTKQSRTVETFDLLNVPNCNCNNSLTVPFPVAIVSHSKLRGILTRLCNCLRQPWELSVPSHWNSTCIHLSSSFIGITTALGIVPGVPGYYWEQ